MAERRAIFERKKKKSQYCGTGLIPLTNEGERREGWGRRAGGGGRWGAGVWRGWCKRNARLLEEEE